MSDNTSMSYSYILDRYSDMVYRIINDNYNINNENEINNIIVREVKEIGEIVNTEWCKQYVIEQLKIKYNGGNK